MDHDQAMTADQQNGKSRTSYRTAYVLCVLFGWLGAHRYYLRRWGTAVLYTFSLGLLGIGVLVDLLTLPLLVRQRRDIEAGIPLPPDEAPWAADEEASWWNFFQLLLRFAILVVLPALTIVIARSLGQPVIVALVFMLLAFSLLLGSISRGLYALEDMESLTERVPLLPLAISVVTRFQKHYAKHPARSVFFYLLYPVLGPLFMLFSPAARSEFRPFLSLFSLVVFGVLFQNILNYFNIFPIAYFWHDWLFGLKTCLFLAIGGIGLFFVCVVPMVSSSFYLSMTGRGLSLRTSAALALLLAGVAAFFASSAAPVTFRGSLTAMEKLNNEDFRADFARMNRLFLESEIDPRSGTQFPYASMQVCHFPESTARYRTFLAGILRKEEAKAFRIVAVYPASDAPTGVPWLAVQFIPDPMGIGGAMGEAVLLYVIPPDGEVQDQWRRLDVRFRRCFTITHRADPRNLADPDRLTAQLLMNDLRHIPSFGRWDYGTLIESEEPPGPDSLTEAGF